VAGAVTAVLALAAATLGPTMIAGAQSGDHLTVNVTGNGSVSDSAGRISCPPTCEADVPHGSFVSLTAMPHDNDSFQQWSGPAACDGSTADKCGFDMSGPTTVGAAFTGTGPQPTPSPSPTATPTPQPTPTPTPTPTPSPSPATLVLKLFAAKVQSLRDTHGRLRLKLRCSRTCKATIKVKVSVPHMAKPVTLPATHPTLPAGETILVARKLPRALRAAIKLNATIGHPATAHVAVAAVAGASSAKATRTVALIP
jgi:hypothetical protein